MGWFRWTGPTESSKEPYHARSLHTNKQELKLDGPSLGFCIISSLIKLSRKSWSDLSLYMDTSQAGTLVGFHRRLQVLAQFKAWPIQ